MGKSQFFIGKSTNSTAIFKASLLCQALGEHEERGIRRDVGLRQGLRVLGFGNGRERKKRRAFQRIKPPKMGWIQGNSAKIELVNRKKWYRLTVHGYGNLWQISWEFTNKKNDMTMEIAYFVLKPARMGGFVNQKL